MFNHYSLVKRIIAQKELAHRVLDEQLGKRQKGSAYKSQASRSENALGSAALFLVGAFFTMFALGTGELVFYGFAGIALFIGYRLSNKASTDQISPTMLPGETFDADLMEDRIQREVYERMQRAGIEPAQD